MTWRCPYRECDGSGMVWIRDGREARGERMKYCRCHGELVAWRQAHASSAEREGLTKERRAEIAPPCPGCPDCLAIYLPPPVEQEVPPTPGPTPADVARWAEEIIAERRDMGLPRSPTLERIAGGDIAAIRALAAREGLTLESEA